MFKRTLWFLILVVACKRSAPGSEATRSSPAGSAEHTAVPAAAPASSELPIDPTKPPPEAGLSTSATLQLGKPAMVVVDGRGDVYSSGMAAADPPRGGRLPALLTLAPGGGHVAFGNVKGASGCAGGDATPADGGDCVSRDTIIQPADGISGIVDHQHSMFLAGVFLGPQRSTEAPPTLDFSDNALGEAFAELSPRIAQTFFIGNGLTPSGATQRFVIPDGATRLFLGYADAPFFQGSPGAYDDNAGGLHVTATQQK
ncbi:MAG TPA: hypothetical protein VK601_18255 [Kofleriaceae bacterium]|nr:hypothetical protein [Kofleriaceae bacterium]